MITHSLIWVGDSRVWARWRVETNNEVVFYSWPCCPSLRYLLVCLLLNEGNERWAQSSFFNVFPWNPAFGNWLRRKEQTPDYVLLQTVSFDLAILAFLSPEQGSFPLRSLELDLWRARLESSFHPSILSVVFLMKSSFREGVRKASLPRGNKILCCHCLNLVFRNVLPFYVLYQQHSKIECKCQRIFMTALKLWVFVTVS